MSGKPNNAQISELRDHAATVADLDRDIARLTQLIDEHSAALDQAREVRARNATEIRRLVAEMDLEQSGNHGWEGRMVYFLAELTRTSEQYGRTHQ